MAVEIKDNYERLKVVEETYKHEMNMFCRTCIHLVYSECSEGNVKTWEEMTGRCRDNYMGEDVHDFYIR